MYTLKYLNCHSIIIVPDTHPIHPLYIIPYTYTSSTNQKISRKAQEHLAQTEGRRATEALEREAILERRLASLELELKAERAGREVTQAHLLEADEGLSQREAAWEAQRQILLDDADRMREELYSVKKERDDFCLRCKVLEGDDEEEKSLLLDGQSDRREVSSVNEGVNGMTELILERKAYEAEVSDLAMNLASMRDELRAKDEEIVELQRWVFLLCKYF